MRPPECTCESPITFNLVGCPIHGAIGKEAYERLETSKRNGVLQVGTSDGLDAHALKEQLDKLLCVVNAVTCPHRHGQPVRPKDLTRLANRQIEVEEALREMGN